MRETSIVTRVAVFIVVVSFILIGFSIYSFMQSQEETLKSILSKSRLDAMELIETNQKLKSKALSEAIWHKANVMSSIMLDQLESADFPSLEKTAMRFFDRAEMEYIYVELKSTKGVQHLNIRKEKETFKSLSTPLNANELLHLLNKSITKELNDGSQLTVSIYFSDEKMILESYNAVSQATNRALLFEKEITDKFTRSSQNQAFIHASVAFVLIAAVAFSLFTLNRTIVLANENLLASNKQLEENIDKLELAYSELQNTQSQLVESEKMAALGNLVAGVAHEIKTPIGVCITAASTIKNRSDKFLKKRAEGTLKESEYDDFIKMSFEGHEMIVSNLHRAGELINSFKQVAVDQTSMAVREFELKSYIKEIINSLKPQLKNNKHEIKVECDDGILINGYPGAIYQIFANLINNSLIHGFKDVERGTIYISAKYANQTVNIVYKDNGIGIPKENIKRVFEPFFTTNRNHGGSGLGMHIVYNLITHKLGGSISCEGGEGALFRISLPIKQI